MGFRLLLLISTVSLGFEAVNKTSPNWVAVKTKLSLVRPVTSYETWKRISAVGGVI